MTVCCSERRSRAGNGELTSSSTIQSNSHKLPEYRNCPKARVALAEREDRSEMATHGGPCRMRSCPVCGKVWLARYLALLTMTVGQHDGPLYTLQCDRSAWQSVYRAIKRSGGLYVAVETGPGILSVLSTVAVRDAIVEPNWNAVPLVYGWIATARPVTKPVLLCSQWKMPRDEKPAAVASNEKPVESSNRETEMKSKAKWRKVKDLRPGTSTEEIVETLRSVGIEPTIIQYGEETTVKWSIPKHWTEEDRQDLIDRLSGSVRATTPPGRGFGEEFNDFMRQRRASAVDRELAFA